MEHGRVPMRPCHRPQLRLAWEAMVKYPTDETWVPLSRGIEEHLPRMVGGCRAALWLLLLVRAQHSGPNRGKVNATFRELADALGVGYSTAYRAAQDLKKVGLIAYEPAPNQHRPTAFTVSKYKGVGDFHPIVALINSEESSKTALINNETAAKKQRKSKPDKVTNISELQDPNNDKNVNKYIVEIVDYLNALTSSQYRPTTRETARLISGRLSEGYTVENCKAVIRNRWEAWGQDPRMREYMRPNTLFRPSNFEGYLQEARRADASEEDEGKELPDGAGRT